MNDREMEKLFKGIGNKLYVLQLSVQKHGHFFFLKNVKLQTEMGKKEKFVLNIFALVDA